MRRVDPDVVGAVVLTLLATATGVPVLVIQLRGGDPTLGPPWLWWAAFVGFLVAMVTEMLGTDALPRRRLLVIFGVQLVLGSVVVLLSPEAGWTPILLVFTAALGAYVLSLPATAAVVVANTGVVGVAGWLVRGSWFEAAFTALVYLLLQVLIVASVLGEQRNQAARRQLAAAHTELRATSALLADASRTAERVRIARDLHDVVGHQVTALALELEVASHHSRPPASEHVTRARRIAKDLLADMRATVAELRVAPPDLRSALAAVVADLPRPVVHLRVADDVAVDDAACTALVRCVQEIVTNTIRHANAEELWIEVLVGADGGTVLCARDDGRGAPEFDLGHGLTGLRERVHQLGGDVEFRSAGGFHVTATVPAP